MINSTTNLAPADVLASCPQFWEISARSIDNVEARCPPGSPSPVFTSHGKYTAKGWTEWTQGFQYGSAILQFDATEDEHYLQLGRQRTIDLMAPHVTHIGVHDHGFNNVSTYGNLWRLMNEGRIPEDKWERNFYELALKVTGAVQATRWSETHDGKGYIYSFNGPQSLFIDTIRSLRALAVSHQLGHLLMGEQDSRVSLLQRIVDHATVTARHNIWYGEERDFYDLRGRTAHESVFNTNNGVYRAPSSQQGYSSCTTWTRGQAWAMLGYAEQLEWLETRANDEFSETSDKAELIAVCLKAAQATCDYYCDETPTCGIPYWDTGAPGLVHLGDYKQRPADPLNCHEPVDSSAAAIAAQGLLRLGTWLNRNRTPAAGDKYFRAGLTTLKTLLSPTYLSLDPDHDGLLLHSVYHRPNDWDTCPPGSTVPSGESSMWGDYHLREAILYLNRIANDGTYYTFFGPTC